MHGTLCFRGLRMREDHGIIPPPPVPLRAELDHDDVLAALSSRLPRNVAVIPSGRCNNKAWASLVLALGDCFVNKDGGLAMSFLNTCYEESVTFLRLNALGSAVAAATIVLIGPTPACQARGMLTALEDVLADKAITTPCVYVALVLTRQTGEGRRLVADVFRALHATSRPHPPEQLVINPPDGSAALYRLYTESWGFSELGNGFLIRDGSGFCASQPAPTAADPAVCGPPAPAAMEELACLARSVPTLVPAPPVLAPSALAPSALAPAAVAPAPLAPATLAPPDAFLALAPQLPSSAHGVDSAACPIFDITPRAYHREPFKIRPRKALAALEMVRAGAGAALTAGAGSTRSGRSGRQPSGRGGP